MGLVGSRRPSAPGSGSLVDRLFRGGRNRHQRDLVLGGREAGRVSETHAPVLADDWLAQALSYPGVRPIDLSPAICVESTQLPGSFHRDPADQLIVATARVLDAVLVTADAKILAYPFVKLPPQMV